MFLDVLLSLILGGEINTNRLVDIIIFIKLADLQSSNSFDIFLAINLERLILSV